MKRAIKVLAFLPLAFLVASCARELNGPEIVLEPRNSTVYTFEASFEDSGTKTTLTPNGNTGKVSWEAGDVINYFSANTPNAGSEPSQFPVTNVIGAGSTQFQAAVSGGFLAAYYGRNVSLSSTHKSTSYILEGAVPSLQDGDFGSSNVAVALTYTLQSGVPNKLVFRNLVSYLNLSISRQYVTDNNVGYLIFSALGKEQINGDLQVNYHSYKDLAAAGTLETVFPSSVSFADESGDPVLGASAIKVPIDPANLRASYLIATLPQTLAGGFSITGYTPSGDPVESVIYAKSFTLNEGEIVNLGDISGRFEREYIDLSAGDKTANSYIVNGGPNYYKFKSVKGNSTETVSGAGLTATVLWQDSASVVSDVEYREGFINFKALGNGNAVIAMSDPGGDVAWSWHIWVSNGFDPEKSAQQYKNNAGTMMDRNLGALSATDNGLLYQWGRKDPFSTAVSYTTVSVGATSADYDVVYPREFILGTNATNGDWLVTGPDNNRWSSDKTVNDPCPAGWRVPSTSVWTVAAGTTASFDGTRGNGGLFDLSAFFGGGIYPANAYINANGAVVSGGALYWATDTQESKALSMFIGADDNIDPVSDFARSFGGSVRCVLDDGVPVESVSLNFSQITLEPGGTKTLIAAVSPVDATNQDIEWTSDDPAVATVDNGVVTAVAEGTCTICASSANGKKAYCTVSVTVNAVTGITLTPDSIVFEPGQTQQLSAVIAPSNATFKTLNWTSSDKTVATVDQDGLVTAVAVGTCTITATAHNGVNAVCPVEVALHAATNLSSNGTANCYIVSAGGDYKFNAKVCGNSLVSTGAIDNAVVLWETFGTSTAPQVGQLLHSVSLDTDGYIHFVVPDNMLDGNAVIAVRNSENTILWSWHIWLSNGYDPVANEQVYYHNAGTMMDRNLGATSAEIGSDGALGLHYQWGRKDPFPAGDTKTSATQAATSVAWPSAVSAGSIEYSIQNPMRFMLAAPTTRDWYTRQDPELTENRWNVDKTMYDPCPAGWRVPDGGSSGVWATALAQSNGYSDAGYYVSQSNGYNFSRRMGDSQTIWYPITAYHVMNGGYIMGNGQYAMYWSCTVPGYSAELGRNEYQAYDLYFYTTQSLQPSNKSLRSYGAAVRCLKEGTFRGVKLTGFSLSRTQVTMKVGDTLQLEPVFVPADASNKNLKWSSQDKNVVTVTSSGLLTAMRATASPKTVTVTTVDGDFVATCDVIVTN